MGILSYLSDLFDRLDASVNPATGLPMLNRSVDVAGNPYGTDLRRRDAASAEAGSSDDHLTGSSFDDWVMSPRHEHFHPWRDHPGPAPDFTPDHSTFGSWPDHSNPTSWPDPSPPIGGGYDTSSQW